MWYKFSNQKKMIIMRGLPGSGKSTKARELGVGGIVLGSDDFWGPNYDFDKLKIGEAHRWNQNRVLEALEQGITPIVVDNTNVSFYEFRPYVEMAQKYKYDVEYVESDSSWKFNTEELAQRNQHNVPLDIIQQMLNRWDYNPTNEDVLKSKAPWEQSELK
jgi:NEDD4-binding protein 2